LDSNAVFQRKEQVFGEMADSKARAEEIKNELRALLVEGLSQGPPQGHSYLLKA
jgi:hypothetical protein